jgi:amino acid transporter
MWLSVFVATLVALATATCYAAFARKYPEAGAGSSYFYSEAAFLEHESHAKYKFARISKLIVGIAAHLYYWVYPGVMVAFMGTILVFIGQLFNPNFATQPLEQMGLCIGFSVIVGAIAFIGVTGSTMANIIINIIQILALLVFSIAAIAFRLQHPELAYEHHSALSVVSPHGASELLFQSTIAILLVVGFESATALAAESKNPKHDIPRGVILSLVIQAVIFYFFEYFAANFFIGAHYAGVIDKSGHNFMLIDPKITSITDHAINQATYAGGSIVNGYSAAGADSAPIGSFCNIIGAWLFHSAKGGFYFELVMALSVVLALIGTALSCLSTGVRVTYAMGKDDELPGVFGFIHGKFNTPYIGIIILTIISAAIGAYGVLNSDNLIKIALISNLGTFILYGITCLVTYIGFQTDSEAPFFSTKFVPIIGVILNVGLMLGDFYFAFAAPSATAATKYDTKCALGITIGFIIISFVYLAFRSAARKQPMILPATKGSV